MKKFTIAHFVQKKTFVALLAGGLTTFAFAPFHLFPFSVVGVALLLYSFQQATPQTAFCRGWLFGLSFFGAGVYWIYISMHTYGHLGALLSLLLTALFISLLALFPALSGRCLNRWFPVDDTIRLLLAFPALWTLLEWLRGILFTGFPWLMLGYSQMLSPLRGYAPLLGVYGVTLAVVLSSGLLVKIIRAYHLRDYQVLWYSLMGLSLLWSVGTVCGLIPWTKQTGTPIQVSLVQGNIPEQLKWTEDMIQPTLSIYSRLSRHHWDSQLVIWPESAIPDFLENQLDFLNKMDALAKRHHSTFITGIPARLEQRYHYYNAVVAFGSGTGYYLKRRLVPFGEYIPFENILSGLMSKLELPFMGFRPGSHFAKPIVSGPLKIMTLICYEVAFPELVRFRNRDVNLLVTLSNDAWFGYSSAQAQHLEMAAMRALETGRPMLMVSNDGPTAIINASGQIVATAPPHTATVLTDRIQPTQGSTPWMLVGMDPVLFIIISLLARSWWRTRRLRRDAYVAPLPASPIIS